jgi:hypothetical protein
MAKTSKHTVSANYRMHSSYQHSTKCMMHPIFADFGFGNVTTRPNSHQGEEEEDGCPLCDDAEGADSCYSSTHGWVKPRSVDARSWVTATLLCPFLSRLCHDNDNNNTTVLLNPKPCIPCSRNWMQQQQKAKQNSSRNRRGWRWKTLNPKECRAQKVRDHSRLQFWVLVFSAFPAEVVASVSSSLAMNLSTRLCHEISESEARRFSERETNRNEWEGDSFDLILVHGGFRV